MTSPLKNHDIRIKIIKLKKSFDLQIKHHHFSQSKKDNRSIFSTVRPYKFTDYDQTQFQKDDQSFPEFYPHNHISHGKKHSVRQSEFSSKQSAIRKLGNLSYKSQKSQRFAKQQLALEDLKRIRSISINNFDSGSTKSGKINGHVAETFEKYENKITKAQQKLESHLNVKQYAKRKFRNFKNSKVISLKQAQKGRIKSEQSNKQENSFTKKFLSSFQNRGKVVTSQQLNEKKFLIDPWQVSQEFMT